LILEGMTCENRCFEVNLTNISIEEGDDDTEILSILKDQKADLV